MNIKYMEQQDKDFVMSIDKHVNEINYNKRVYTKTGYVIYDNEQPVGIMHYSVLWDNLPFLNFISINDEFRNRGIGKKAMIAWEEDMKKQGYKMVLISTQVDEGAQHFYRKLGYVDCGALLFTGTPMEQPMEMFMSKVLS